MDSATFWSFFKQVYNHVSNYQGNDFKIKNFYKSKYIKSLYFSDETDLDFVPLVDKQNNKINKHILTDRLTPYYYKVLETNLQIRPPLYQGDSIELKLWTQPYFTLNWFQVFYFLLFEHLIYSNLKVDFFMNSNLICSTIEGKLYNESVDKDSLFEDTINNRDYNIELFKFISQIALELYILEKPVTKPNDLIHQNEDLFVFWFFLDHVFFSPQLILNEEEYIEIDLLITDQSEFNFYQSNKDDFNLDAITTDFSILLETLQTSFICQSQWI